MSKHDDDADYHPSWYCVLDRNMRQTYLGHDHAEALRLCGEGCVIGSAPLMGDAMVRAGLKAGERIKPRPRREP